MRLVELTATHARIPLKRRIRHASHTRTDNDTLLIRARLDDGTIGWGEGLPREYVTGETIETAWEHFARFDFGAVLGGELDARNVLANVAGRLEMFTSTPLDRARRSSFGNAFRCAVELAVLDAVCRSLGRPLSAVFDAIPGAEPLRQNRDRAQYSGALSSTGPIRTLIGAGMFRYYGFEFCKVKVGKWPLIDPWNVRAIRHACGRKMDLRVDANEAWRPDDVERRVAALRPARISAVEQPVRHTDVERLATIRPRLGVDVILDESLCSTDDAQRAIDLGLCDIFNLRLSKCGGIVRTGALARMARAAGLEFQLGCQVGETGLLSAAGRHFACKIGPLRYVEGSFDRLLVAEPLIKEDITFRRGGWGARLEGPGLGVTVDLDAVRRVTIRENRRTLG
ncbi:L-Ala-D/L-Glu epimerase [Caulifigura coniformis]|uniref:L-Ala-D/L-Glu epimerase n=1 Tax=Caulifigura coniformis TaxID=2527983 RepID=A0A517SJ00_9PLAN|nr:enolase C-terminal domain-like protein [Caulifigura coniformis]QDT56101.1 L-Ala-D/L-Glu epimerase [Caulifigura coniformis]